MESKVHNAIPSNSKEVENAPQESSEKIMEKILCSPSSEASDTKLSGPLLSQSLSSPDKLDVSFRKRKESMFISDAIKQLESEGKINLHLSPSDNAVSILESVLPYNLEDTARASIVYALEVLKSDSSQASVPIGLQSPLGRRGRSTTPAEASRRSSVGEGPVLDWLMSTYTPTAHSPQIERLTFHAPRGVRLRAAAAATRRSSARGALLYDAEAGDVEAIEAALEGVDEWDWDVWRLRQATKGRPLRALGWHLLEKVTSATPRQREAD